MARNPGMNTNACDMGDVNAALRQVGSFMRGDMQRSSRNMGVIGSVEADVAVDIHGGAPGLSFLALDNISPKYPEGNVTLPDWIHRWDASEDNATYDGDIIFSRTGVYQLSWVINFSPNGSGGDMDYGKSYLRHTNGQDGAITDSVKATYTIGHGEFASTALVFPATLFEIYEGDTISIIIECILGDSSSNWTIKAGSFVNITRP